MSLGKAGVVDATLLVTGNIMGSGIFMVPVALASFGSVASVSWLLSVVGAVCLALVYAKLSSGDDAAAGGSYGFTKKAFGPLVACVVNATYFLSVVFGNVAGALVGVGYVAYFVEMGSWGLAVATVAVIWCVTSVNLYGPRVVMRVQGVCTVLTCVPIFFVAAFGWIAFDPALFWASWNTSGVSDALAVQRCLNVQLWAFTGLETAAAVSSIVRNPRRDVPIATCSGVLIAALGYTLSSTVIMGLFPASVLGSMSAPYAHAVRVILGGSDWGASLVAAFAVVGCVGSLAGWMLVAGQTSIAAADDGLFPSLFAAKNASGINQQGLLLVSALMTAIVLGCSLPALGAHPFAVVSSLSSLLTLVPYSLTAAALQTRVGQSAPAWSAVALISMGYCASALVGSNVTHTLLSLCILAIAVASYYVFAAPSLPSVSIE
jgi:arginine:agmatine antiporter